MKRRLVILATLAILPGMAWAQGLSDPTRPPLELMTGGTGDAPASLLQSVLMSGGRKLAVINGQVVPLGGKYGEARLVRIEPTEVTLQSGQATEVLKLYPSGERRSPHPARQDGPPETGLNRGK
jgi:MSHA biogenesis protein MshK